MIRVEGISYSYGNFQALKDVRFLVERSSVVFVIGPNGSGKSTLLKCLARILKPEGAVYVDGKSIYDFSHNELAKIVGYVPQRSEVNFLTVFDFVLLGRKPHFGWKARKEDLEIVEKTLELMNLREHALKKLNELSGGELQKVAIARALSQEPKILLLDEPTSNLDIKNQVEFLSVLRRIVKEKGILAVITTHDLNLAATYADKIIMMKKGRVYASGGVEVLSEENIKAVYGIDVEVVRVNGRVIIFPKRT